MARMDTDFEHTETTDMVPRMRHVARNTSARRFTPATAIAAGVGAQLIGVGWEALWHIGLAARAEELGLPANLGVSGRSCYFQSRCAWRARRGGMARVART